MSIRIPQFLQANIIVFTEDTFAIGLAGCWAAVHNGFPKVGIIAVFYDGGAGELLSPFKLDAFVGVFNCLVVGVGSGSFYSTLARAAVIHHLHEIHIIAVL